MDQKLQQQNFKQFGHYIFSWGSGKDGRLGNNSEIGEKVPQLMKNIDYIFINSGYYHTAGIDKQGQLWMWGKGNMGQLGLGNYLNQLQPRQVSNLSKTMVKFVSCGWQHTIALTYEGQIYSWGLGDEGQLGHGNKLTLAQPKQLKFFENHIIDVVSCGHSHSGAITNQGEFYSWGANPDNRLMIEDNKNQYLPKLTVLQKYLKENEIAINISLGVNHTAVVTNYGKLFTAGSGNYGQLGTFILPDSLNKTNDLKSMQQNQKNTEDLCCVIFQVQEFGNYKQFAIQAACGDHFTLVLTQNGQVFSFGKSGNGCLGHPDLQTDDKLYQPKLIESLKNIKIKSISVGKRHSAAISEQGQLYTWGFNFYDQLGVGDHCMDSRVPIKVDLPKNLLCTQISCGDFHTICLCVDS